MSSSGDSPTSRSPGQLEAPQKSQEKCSDFYHCRKTSDVMIWKVKVQRTHFSTILPHFCTNYIYYSSKSLIFLHKYVKCECQNVVFSCCLVPLFQNLHGDTEHVWCRGSSKNFPVHFLCWCKGQSFHTLKKLHVWMWFGQHLQDCCTGICYTVHQYLHSISWRADDCKVYVYTFVVYN